MNCKENKRASNKERGRRREEQSGLTGGQKEKALWEGRDRRLIREARTRRMDLKKEDKRGAEERRDAAVSILIDKVTPSTTSIACGVKETSNSMSVLKQLPLSSFGNQVSKVLLINAWENHTPPRGGGGSCVCVCVCVCVCSLTQSS